MSVNSFVPDAAVAVAVESAVLARHGRVHGDEITYTCTSAEKHANGDQHPSASYNTAKYVYSCPVCGAGGGILELASALAIDVRARGEGLPGAGPRRTAKPTGINLDEYARLKQLDPALLRADGVEDATYCRAPAVWIPAHLPDGTVDGAGQFRVKTKGPGHLISARGKKVRPFGLHQLGLARARGYVVCVEGPSCKQTLGQHDEPALGLPGADVSRDILTHLPEWLAGIRRVYIVREPGAGGLTFVKRIAEAIAADRLAVMDLAPYKDASEMYLADAAAFAERWGAAMAAAVPFIPDSTTASAATDASASPIYEIRGHRTYWLKKTRDGQTAVALSNFEACIVAEITRDDGVEENRHFVLKGTLASGITLPEVSIAGSEFGVMRWPMRAWGSRAVVSAGMGAQDRLREAIQVLSPDVPQQRLYTHTGWRELNGQHVYLHGAGAIDRNGTRTDVAVELAGPLERFVLPEPPNGADLIAATRASLRMLEVAPHTVTMPVLCTVFRAVLGSANFSAHLHGPTGVAKTQIAALAQQHYGREMDDTRLPGSWMSTANALAETMFRGKDALVVVDDFAPAGSTIDVQRLHRDADRLLRGQGNLSARQRLRPDATLRPGHPPRGLILSTGEDIPHGQSLGSRIFLVAVSPTDVNWSRLTRAQRDARDGLYAAAMAGYLRWLAPRYAELRRGHVAAVEVLRDQVSSAGVHRRTPTIVAELILGMQHFLTYAVDIGVISNDESLTLLDQCRTALLVVAEVQTEHQTASEPARRFIELVAAALASGQAHVANATGLPPDQASAWGWRADPFADLRPQGPRIGWIEDDDLYLQPEAAFKVAKAMSADGDGLLVSLRTLHRRLKERGFLASIDEKRDRVLVRRVLDGVRREVLHLPAAVITVGPSQTSQPGPTGRKAQEDGPVGGPVDASPRQERPAERPTNAEENGNAEPVGPVGPLVREDSPEREMASFEL